ncbi:MAG: topoisomerase C-terminal repeat-containing protein [Anaerolineae bacterium]
MAANPTYLAAARHEARAVDAGYRIGAALAAASAGFPSGNDDAGKRSQALRSLHQERQRVPISDRQRQRVDDLDRALELPAEGNRAAPAAPIREVGAHPTDSQPITLMSGRFSPYVKHGAINAAAEGDDPAADARMLSS